MLNLCISHINQGFTSLQTLRIHRQDGNEVKKERKLEYVVAFPYHSGRVFNTPTVPMQAKHTQFYMLCNVCLTINFIPASTVYIPTVFCFSMLSGLVSYNKVCCHYVIPESNHDNGRILVSKGTYATQ